MNLKVPQATKLFQYHREQLGFVNKAQVDEKDLVVECSNQQVIGALLGNHGVRKKQSTIYEIAVYEGYRRQGVGSSLVESFASESPHDKIVAKCPVDLPANKFYLHTGWDFVGKDPGKNTELAIWELSI